eukprot:GHVS01025130.1.p1 GENE.GHVS01025130.1~~GHVS01025130.1.p1  ORF type:complete len:466 (-),score=85.98 GHVS01025130.1:352-1749(-)
MVNFHSAEDTLLASSSSLPFCPIRFPPLHHSITTSLICLSLAAAVHIFMATAAVLIFRGHSARRQPTASLRPTAGGDYRSTAVGGGEGGRQRASSRAGMREVLLAPLWMMESLLNGLKLFLQAGLEETSLKEMKQGGMRRGQEGKIGKSDHSQKSMVREDMGRRRKMAPLWLGREESSFCLWVWFFCLGCAVVLMRVVDEGWLVSHLWTLPHRLSELKQYQPFRRPTEDPMSEHNFATNGFHYGRKSLDGIPQPVNLTDGLTSPHPLLSFPPPPPIFTFLLLILQGCRHYCLACALFDTKHFLFQGRRRGLPVRRVRVLLLGILLLYMGSSLVAQWKLPVLSHTIAMILFVLLRLSGLYFLSCLATKEEVFSSYRDSRHRSSCGHLIVGASLLLVELFPLDITRLVVRRGCGPGGFAGADVVTAVEVMGTLCLFAHVGEDAERRVDRRTTETLRRIEETFDLDSP